MRRFGATEAATHHACAPRWHRHEAEAVADVVLQDRKAVHGDDMRSKSHWHEAEAIAEAVAQEGQAAAIFVRHDAEAPAADVVRHEAHHHAAVDFIRHETAAAADYFRHEAKAVEGEVASAVRGLKELALHEAEAVEGEAAHAVEGLKDHISRLSALVTERETLDENHWFVHSSWFQAFITIATVANAFQMGLATDFPDWKFAWLICDHFFTAVFAAEMVIKLCVIKARYFNDKANLLDAFLALLSIVDCWILPIVGSMGGADLRSLSVLRVLRLMRLVRLLKLFRSWKQLVLVIHGTIKAMGAACYVVIVCISIMYVFAIFCTEYLGKDNDHLYPGFSTEQVNIDEWEVMINYNPHLCFGNMAASMFTLFNFATGTEWTDVVRPIFVKQPFFVPVLLLFVLFVAFCAMNVLAAVIVDVVVNESKALEREYFKESKKRKLELLGKVEILLRSIDQNGDGLLGVEEMDHALKESGLLRELLESINLPLGWDPKEMINMLDKEGSGKLSYTEFTTGFIRLMDTDDFQQICIMQSSINEVKKLLHEQSQKFEVTYSTMQADIASIKAVVGASANRQGQLGGQPTMSWRTPCGKSSDLQSSAVHKVAALVGEEEASLEERLAGSSEHRSSKDIMMYLDARFTAMKASMVRSESLVAAANTILQDRLTAIEEKFDLHLAKTFHQASSDSTRSSAGLEESPPLHMVGRLCASRTDALQNPSSKKGGRVHSDDIDQVPPLPAKSKGVPSQSFNHLL